MSRRRYSISRRAAGHSQLSRAGYCFDGQIPNVRHHRDDIDLCRGAVVPLWPALHVDRCCGPNDKHCDAERD